MTKPGRLHGILITYRRPGDLENFLDVLERQTMALDSLVVVDNDADPTVEERVRSAERVARSVTYVGCADNMGPAGGIHAGIEDVLASASDDDWIVLLDDDDPPQREDCLEVMGGLLGTLCRVDASTAGLGLWGARLNKMTGRVRAAQGHQPEQVDYLPGSALPHYSVGALRLIGAPEPEMFFGFDDLELGLRLRDAGFNLYSTGAARDHGLAHMVEGRSTSVSVEAPTWRRYYSLRNSIVVLRRHGAIGGALYRSLIAGVMKPIVNIPRRPRLAFEHLRLNIRAIRDGWLGRLGKTIDPDGLPAPRRNAAPR